MSLVRRRPNRRSGQFARKTESCRAWRKIGGVGIFPDVQYPARGRTTGHERVTKYATSAARIADQMLNHGTLMADISVLGS